MKKILCLFACLLLLAGCAAAPEDPTDPSAQTPPTISPTEPEQTPPCLVEQGIAWDREGVLLQIPLTVPDGWKYSGFCPYGEDLLGWYLDTHLENEYKLGLCVIDLSTGTVAAQNIFDVGGGLTPQILGEDIYLCDSAAGQITGLDQQLQQVRHWQAEPNSDEQWFISSNQTLYRLDQDQLLLAQPLSGSQTEAILPEASQVSVVGSASSYLPLEYFDDSTGASIYALLDLYTDQVVHPPFDGKFSSVCRAGDQWLCALDVYSASDSSSYYIGTDDQPFWLNVPNANLTLLQEGYVLETTYDGQFLRLYDTSGKLISQCRLSEDFNSYTDGTMIWNEALGGYFFRLYDYNGSNRLMFWDIGKGSEGEDLLFEPVPALSESTVALRTQADKLEETYGVNILLGQECSTEFSSFAAEQIDDYITVATALETLEKALSRYPDGFFRQLRYGGVHGIEIQLVANLTATDDQRYGGSYSAFVEEMWDYNLLVADIYSCSENSYYHEFSHIIDNYLFWDSCQRTDAVFSEEQWMSLNPEGFDYAYDYAAEYESYLSDEDENYFIDTYSTISPTEDRARVMEYAMGTYSGWVFDEYEGIREKLDYYCRCIEDTFDTQSWPEDLPWEQYLG